MIQTEIAILTLVQHKNIVELIDTFEAKDVISLFRLNIRTFTLSWSYYGVVNSLIAFVVVLYSLKKRHFVSYIHLLTVCAISIAWESFIVISR